MTACYKLQLQRVENGHHVRVQEHKFPCSATIRFKSSPKAIKIETKVRSKTQSCQDVPVNIQVLSHIQLECMLHLRIGAAFTEKKHAADIMIHYASSR